MSTRSKIKGTKFETAVVKFLAEADIDAARQPLYGRNDKGDIVCYINKKRIIIECKHRATFTRSDMDKFLEQTLVESFNAQAYYGVLITKKNGQSTNSFNCYVVSPLHRHRIHFFLDELVDGLKELCLDGG